MGAYDDRPYVVGKGKPPQQHRWKPGQSGNPKGPKRKANPKCATMNELLADIVNQTVFPTFPDKNGKPKTIAMPLRQFILKKLAEDAVNSTPHHRLKVVNALVRLGAFDLQPSHMQLTPQQQEEQFAKFIHGIAALGVEDGSLRRESDDPDDPAYYRYQEID